MSTATPGGEATSTPYILIATPGGEANIQHPSQVDCYTRRLSKRQLPVIATPGGEASIQPESPTATARLPTVLPRPRTQPSTSV